MREIKITDSDSQTDGFAYVRNALFPLVDEFEGNINVTEKDGRVELLITCQERLYDLFKTECEDKIADIIAVKYKYDFFSKRIISGGLSLVEKEILFSALIAADLDDDKRYIIRRLRLFDNFAVDGVFNFRLKPLKGKWADIVSYIPTFFTAGQLTDFVSYLVGEKRGRKVIIKDEKVYDGNYNLLRRTSLTGKNTEGKIVREVILSASGMVEVASKIPETDEKYLKRFYGRKISFSGVKN